MKREHEVERMINDLAPNYKTSEIAFLEGETRAARTTVRNPRLREAAKKKWGLRCYCCGFDYEVFYGAVAKDLAIVHHLKVFQHSNGKPRRATVNDVRVVCANCHHVIHVEKEPIALDDLKERISESWTVWSQKGISRR